MVTPSIDDPRTMARRADLRRALDAIAGRWKLEILWLLSQRKRRFGELRRGLPGITQHMLTVQLRKLEADGLVKRTAYAEIPPRVEYEIMSAARQLGPVFEAIFKWAAENPPPHKKGRGKAAE